MNTAFYLQRESSISINVIFEIIASAVSGLMSAVNAPMSYLTQYYSYCLERQVSIKQTFCLTIAQIAFVVMVISFCISMLIAILGVALFAGSLYMCKRVL